MPVSVDQAKAPYPSAVARIPEMQEFADCSNPGGFALCLQSQARELNDSRWCMLARQLLYFAENLVSARSEAHGQNQKSSRLTYDDKLHNEVVRISITRSIAGCCRLLIFTQCLDRPP